jgi:hypothetical protein
MNHNVFNANLIVLLTVLGCGQGANVLCNPIPKISECGVKTITGSGLTSLVAAEDATDVTIPKNRWPEMEKVFNPAYKCQAAVSGPVVGCMEVEDACGNTVKIEFYASAQAPLMFDVDGVRYRSDYSKEFFDPSGYLLGIIAHENELKRHR